MMAIDGREVVRLDSVSIERAGHLVLEELNFRISAGDWVLLCGPSGAGKSSLLRVLAGLDEPAKGTMSRLGMTVSSGAKLRKPIGWSRCAPESKPGASLYCEYCCGGHRVGFTCRNVAASEARSRSEEMAEALGVGHLLERPCHALELW